MVEVLVPTIVQSPVVEVSNLRDCVVLVEVEHAAGKDRKEEGCAAGFKTDAKG